MTNFLPTLAAAATSPTEQVAAQQALEILQRVQTKVLLEMWTTIVLTAGVLSVFLAQILLLCGFRRIASFFLMLFGYAMTWVPAQLPIYIGYAVIILGLATIIRDSMSGRDEPVRPRSRQAA